MGLTDASAALASILSTLVVAIAAIVIAISRIGSRLARLEEWVRVTERRERAEHGQPPADA